MSTEDSNPSEARRVLYGADGSHVLVLGDSRPRLWRTVVTAILTAVSIVGIVTYFRVSPAVSPAKIFFDGPLSELSANKGIDARWNLWIESARRATQIWEKAGVHLPALKLVAPADAKLCGPKAIACTDRQSLTIYVVDDGSTVDRTTVMLHEIGHAIGVPHIQGDALMNAEYGGPVESVPAEVVAFAKAKQFGGVVIDAKVR